MIKHQQGCPLASVAASHLATLQGVPDYNFYTDESEFAKPCPDRRCSTWLDLNTWFGFKPHYLPSMEFSKCFTDIAHGGNGIYEKLVVLGTKSLEVISKVYVSEKFTKSMLPYDLQRGLPDKLLRAIWTMKRVERITSVRSLSLFSKHYLSTSQSLPSPASVSMYLKACIGYAIQSNTLQRGPSVDEYKIECYSKSQDFDRTNRLLYDWATILIDNMYYLQKLRVGSVEVENELVQDLQEYFGYPYDTIIPRVRNIISASFSDEDIFGQCQTGKDILKLVAINYFTQLGKNSNLDQQIIIKWLEDEIKIFLDSKVVHLFASTYFNLKPILDEKFINAKSSPSSDNYAELFYQLLAAVYSVTMKRQSDKFLNNLMNRLRQIQILIHMSELDLQIYGVDHNTISLFQGVDIFRWSTIADWSKSKYNHWLRDPKAFHLESYLSTQNDTLRNQIYEKKMQNVVDKVSESNENNYPKKHYVKKCLYLNDDRADPVNTEDKISLPLQNNIGNVKLRLVTNKKKRYQCDENCMNPKKDRLFTLRNDKFSQDLAKKLDGELYKPPLATFMKPRIRLHKIHNYIIDESPENRESAIKFNRNIDNQQKIIKPLKSKNFKISHNNDELTSCSDVLESCSCESYSSSTCSCCDSTEENELRKLLKQIKETKYSVDQSCLFDKMKKLDSQNTEIQSYSHNNYHDYLNKVENLSN